MATTEVTPNISSTADAGSSVSSSSSTSVDTSVSTSSTTESSPVTTSTSSTLTPNVGESEQEFLQRFQEEKAKPVEESKPAAEPAEAKPEVVEAAPAETTEETPEVKADETAEDDSLIKPDELDLEDKEFYTPQRLAQEAKQNPELQALFDKHPAIKGELMRALRVGAETQKFKEVFPDIESATFAKDQASVFTNLSGAFYNADTMEGTQGFLTELAQLNILTGEDGQPLLDAKGQPQYSDVFTKFLDNVADINLNWLRGNAEKTNDEELKAALEIISERTRGTSPASEELPAHLKAKEEELKQRESSLNAQQQAEAKAQRQSFETSIAQKTDAHLDKRFAELGKHYQLAPFVFDAVKDKIVDKLHASIKSDPQYVAQRDRLAMLPPTADTQRQREALIQRKIDSIFTTVAKPILKEAGAQIVAAQSAKDAKLATQIAASKSEPKGAATHAMPKAPPTTAQAIGQIKAEHPDWDEQQILAAFTESKMRKA